VPDDPFLSPHLSAFRRVRLFEAPTPLQPAPRLSAALGPDVLVKRDDLTVLGLGGNKVRKLEYLLGRATAEGCDTVVTFGALQSNHARQTAAACAVAGLRCELVLTRAVPRSGEAFDRGGNVALDHLFGATVTVVDNDDDLIAGAVAEVTERITARGSTASWIPPGGSDAVGTLGYVAAGMELGEQILELDRHVGDVVVAVSTGGTYAGLLTGLRIAGSLAKVHGVCVYKPAARTREVVEGLLGDVAGLLGRRPLPATAVHLDDSFLGDGYGLPNPGTLDALRTFARTEALVLDPVYTGKAAEALVAWAGERRFGAGSGVVFVHTGGAPGLGAYPDLDLS
jgi:D-cysteine desulfhydrase family pyridoxal phosphate-dependent enzyme